MRRRIYQLRFVALFSLLSGLVFPAAWGSESAQQQELLKVRLETPLTSYASKPGSGFQAIVVAPCEQNGQVLIPRDSQVFGVVRRAVPVGLGIKHERAHLDLEFRYIRMPDGRQFPLRAKLVSIDNAREHVTSKGEIRGVLAARHPDDLINGFWYKASPSIGYRALLGLTGVANQVWEHFEMGPFGAAALLAVQCTLLPFPEPEIRLPPGADMNLAVDVPPGSFPAYPAPQRPEVPAALADWVQKQPREITRPKGPAPEDIINMAFVGSRQELIWAFEESGWSVPARRGVRSFSHFYGAWNDMRDYANAPVSNLDYRGNLPDLIFERSLNTVTQRDHIRLWRVGRFHNEEVWLGAATHDRGIAFRAARFKFTHKIDRSIDTERSDVIDDLTFTGCSEPASYVASSSNIAPSDRIVTDGRIAVLFLSGCSEGPELESSPMPKRPGNKLRLLARRLILVTRNYVLRDNPYYLGYSLIRWHQFAHDVDGNQPASSNEITTEIANHSPQRPPQISSLMAVSK